MADIDAIRRQIAKRSRLVHVDSLRAGASLRLGLVSKHPGRLSKAMQVHAEAVGRGERTVSPMHSRLKKG